MIVSIGDDRCALPLHAFRTAIGHQHALRFPGLPRWSVGAIRVWDDPSPVPVLCLRQVFDLPPADDDAPTAYAVIRCGDLLALRVDTVATEVVTSEPIPDIQVPGLPALRLAPTYVLVDGIAAPVVDLRALLARMWNMAKAARSGADEGDVHRAAKSCRPPIDPLGR